MQILKEKVFHSLNEINDSGNIAKISSFKPVSFSCLTWYSLQKIGNIKYVPLVLLKKKKNKFSSISCLKNFSELLFSPLSNCPLALGSRSYRLLIRNLTRILHGKWARKSDITLPFPGMLWKESSDKIMKWLVLRVPSKWRKLKRRETQGSLAPALGQHLCH